MLTADLVIARRRGAELHLVKLDDAARSRARTIAAALIDATNANVGNAREEVETAIDAVLVAAQDERLKAGLAKLIDDRVTWEEALGDDAVALRSALFTRAAASRKALDVGERFDRARIVDEAARENGMTADALERAIYADLRGAQRLLAAPPISAESLVLAWERGQSQAVLLRAIKVTVDVRCATAGATRAFFHRLKFLRLLHVVTKTEEGHRVVIDGPFSLFESVTKYGLQLAFVLPILDGCDSWRLEADIRWGKERTPLVFKLEGAKPEGGDGGVPEAPALPDEIATLVKSLSRATSEWRISPAKTILDLPGVGLCVPDLVLEREGARVYLEVMGFWSRDAVWRRVELVQRGLTVPILFAVSARLRVSEAVLDDDASSALYVYKGTLNARAILERVEALREREMQQEGAKARR